MFEAVILDDRTTPWPRVLLHKRMQQADLVRSALDSGLPILVAPSDGTQAVIDELVRRGVLSRHNRVRVRVANAAKAQGFLRMARELYGWRAER